MNLKRITAIVLLCGLLIPLLIKAQQVKVEDSIDLFVKKTMQQRHIPALQLSVVRNGKIVKNNSYGIANLENAIPATENTIFAINSITKAFVGVAMMQLAEEGKLKINDPIALYLDSLPVSWQKITLRQVLSHTSGLRDIEDPMDNLFGAGDENRAWQKVKTLPLEFNPGDRFSYNQTGYIILGKIITKLSGTHFTDFIQNRQFKVANMKLSRFGDSFDVVSNSAGAYTLSKNIGGRWIRNNSPGVAYMQFPVYFRTADGIMSTAKEMAQWLIALQEGKLLKNKASLDSLWTPAILNNGKTGGFSKLSNGYALGWPTIIREEHPAVAPVGGGRSALFVYLKDDLSIVMLTNLMGANPDRLIDEVAGYYIPEMREANGFGLPPGVKQLRTALIKEGFENPAAVVAKLKKKDAAFKLKEDELNEWGYQLLNQKEMAKALAIFKLNVALYPESSNPYDSLGEILEIMGDHKGALLNYKKSLSLNPANKNASDRIKALSGN